MSQSVKLESQATAVLRSAEGLVLERAPQPALLFGLEDNWQSELSVLRVADSQGDQVRAGDLLVVSEAQRPQDGDLVVISQEAGTVLRVHWRVGGRKVVLPLEPGAAPLALCDDSPEFLGTVVAIIRLANAAARVF